MIKLCCEYLSVRCIWLYVLVMSCFYVLITLRQLPDMIKIYSQMYRTDKYSQHSSINWPVWLNGGVLDYELSGCGFEFSYLDLFEIISSFWLVAKIIRWKRSKSIFSFFLTKYNFYFQQRSSNNYLNSTHMFQWIFSILSNLPPFLH